MKMRLFIIIFAVFLLAGVIIFLSAPTVKEFKRSEAIDKEIDKLQAEAEKINTNNDFLKRKIEYLKSDSYKERIAKDRLNLRNPGEKIIIVQPEVSDNIKSKEQNNSPIDATTNIEKNYLSNIQKWFTFLFNK